MKPSRITLALLMSAPFAQAEFDNSSYSYLGLGAETVDYQESTNDFGGLKFKSSFQGTNVVQKSGGYTAIGDRYGFFLSTSSTLLAQEDKEEWKFPDIGVVQEDTMTVKRTGIDILGVFHLQNGHYFTLGSSYSSVSFSRFDFSNTDFTDALNDAIFALPAYSDANLQATLNDLIAQAAASGGCVADNNGVCIGSKQSDGSYTITLDDYKDALKFNPEATAGVVFEDMTTWNLAAGWGYDSIFVNKTGVRYQAAVRVASAVYENILNTNNNKSLSRTFGGDIALHALAGVGYQFMPEFGVMASVEYNSLNHSRLNEGGSSKAFLPKSEFWSLSPQVTAYWAF